MLSELTIHNFAIIERQSLSFHSRFNVISGETGAGKSIILHALEFILGGKGSTSLIRTGAEQMEVQALFDLSEIPGTVRDELPEIVGDGDELVVSRTQPREGRGKVLINGRLGTASLLEEIVRKIVNICSQHHQTKLLDPRFHLELLDGYADCEKARDKMRDAYSKWSALRNELARLEQARGKSAERRAELRQIVEELEALPNLRSGRRTELESEIKRIGNFERLNRAGQQAIELLTGDDGLAMKMREVSGVLAELNRLDPATTTILSDFETARDALTRGELSVARYLHTIDADTSTLENLREELSELARLERKYRVDDAGLCELRLKAEQELSRLGDEGGLRELQEQERALFADVMSAGTALRAKRTRAAASLMSSVGEALRELNMADASLEVRCGESEPSARGIDKIEFLISTNKGERFSPLTQIASGGELSRVMLVLKKILREQSGVNVLIFDEVDSGISGGVARSVGRMLKDISEQSQVICITHLPQVASLSDKHFLVHKEVGDRAVTVVRALSDNEKVDEIARMLAGFTITEASRASARELIESR